MDPSRGMEMQRARRDTFLDAPPHPPLVTPLWAVREKTGEACCDNALMEGFRGISPTSKVEALRNETDDDAFFVGVHQRESYGKLVL